jgi:hypothetical protein
MAEQFWENLNKVTVQNFDLIQQLEQQKFLNADLKERGQYSAVVGENYYVKMPRTIEKQVVRFLAETRISESEKQMAIMDLDRYNKYIVDGLYMQLAHELRIKNAMHITTEYGIVRGEIMVAL